MFKAKKLKTAAFVFVLSLAAFLNAVAQKTTFDENNFYKLKARAREMLSGKTLRITTTEELFEKGSNTSIKSEKYINEIIPPDRTHFVVEKKTAKGIERTEYIDIGRERFIRENDGEWKIFKGGGSGSGAAAAAETLLSRKSKRASKTL